jgi:4-amino-4-deoxy-L-arabinose transferase-like glycosyltransferase
VLAIGLAAGLLTFDVKPSTGGDDTSYVLQAIDIVSTGHIPIGFRTPGYPIVLAFFVWIFGVKLILLKATSLVFFLGIIASLYLAFRNRIHTMTLYPVMLFVAINPLLLEYAHQTYSEMLFALLLIWTIHFVLRASEKESVWFAILAAVLSMISFYIRVAGVPLVGAAILFFLLHRRWKQLVIFILTCVVLYSPIKIYEWTSGAAAFGQASILLLKNPYNTLQGTETLSGFADRFINNTINHLNYQIPSALGFPMPQEIAGADGRILPNTPAFFGFLISLILLAGYIPQIIAKPKSLLAFLGCFLLIYFAFISLVLQNLFATTRMLVPIVPFLFIGTLEGCRWLGIRSTSKKKVDEIAAGSKTFVLIAFIGLLSVNSFQTKDVLDDNLPVLKANLSGNTLAGFTEDWANYIRAVQWIKSNLPMESTRVICRKPEFFSLYAGNYVLYGAYKIDQVDPDSIVAKWKMLKMTHLLYDDFQWTSTLRRYIQPVAEKYPQMFELVHQEGSQFPSYIFRLNYASATELSVQKKESIR